MKLVNLVAIMINVLVTIYIDINSLTCAYNTLSARALGQNVDKTFGAR